VTDTGTSLGMWEEREEADDMESGGDVKQRIGRAARRNSVNAECVTCPGCPAPHHVPERCANWHSRFVSM